MVTTRKWSMNKLWWVLGILIILLLGMFSLAELVPVSLFNSKELASPSDWIKEQQIKVYPTQVVIDVNNPVWASFTNTNSMDPFIDETSNAIEIKPNSPLDIKVGDVISYQTKQGVIIHRVVKVDRDEKGIYYLVKGDNNIITDPFKIRFNEVVGVVVAVIY
tara:strand:+ start:196 stop:681 length:486 start_codon:yes stop_codon:yes gene_type:complete